VLYSKVFGSWPFVLTESDIILSQIFSCHHHHKLSSLLQGHDIVYGIRDQHILGYQDLSYRIGITDAGFRIVRNDMKRRDHEIFLGGGSRIRIKPKVWDQTFLVKKKEIASKKNVLCHNPVIIIVINYH